MIPSVVFVAAVALKKKFLLSSKFSRIPGMMPKIIHVFCRSWESVWPGSSWKVLEGVTVVRCWRVPLAGRQVVFLIRKLCPRLRLNHNCSALLLDSDNGVCCHHCSVYIRALYTTALGPNPTCEAISPGRNTFCQYLWKMRWFNRMVHIPKKSIKQDVWPLNCCAIAYVVSPKKFEEPWSAWIGWTIADASTRVLVLNCRMNCLRFADEMVLHAWIFSTGSSARIWSVFWCVRPNRNEKQH